MKGTTPAQVRLKSNREHSIRLVLEGYREEQVQLEYGTSPWILGNVVCCGLLPGIMVDAATGGAHTLKRESVFVNLEEREGE